MCAILPPELVQYGPVGLPVPSCEIKLIDVPDAGYTACTFRSSSLTIKHSVPLANNPPQGEVCIRGHSVTKGYFKRPDLNEVGC